MLYYFFLLSVFAFPMFSVASIWVSGASLTKEEKIRITQQISEQIHQHKKQKDHSSLLTPDQNAPGNKKYSSSDEQNIKMILQLPLENRNQALQNYGSKSFPVLRNLFSDEKQNMQIRWSALTSMARLYPEASLSIVTKALQHPIWFIRNAGLVALKIINPPKAIQWAGAMLNDPSLVVRTAAVQIIHDQKASQYKPQLLEKLNAKDSFHKNRSLWIRHHIVSALASFAESGEEKFFISLLNDTDTRVQTSAMQALEKISGRSFQTKDSNQAQSEKDMWLQWWSQTNKQHTL